MNVRNSEPKPRNAELSPEDALRLQVMLQNAQAIRIDESRMTAYGLTEEREMTAELNPICHPDRYVERVRQMLSTHILGAPGGYPVFIQRWTRSGDITAAHLDRLLMLGDPEAALAVARAPDLTEELAGRVWWAAPTAEVGRWLLQNPVVVDSAVGREIAEYLVELLPFESAHLDVLDTVRLIIQPGLLSEERRQRLWQGARSRSTYLAGFLHTCPDDLPDPLPARSDLDAHAEALDRLATTNPYAAQLRRLLDSPGQTFLARATDAARRPADQDVVNAWLNAIGRYFAAARVYTDERQYLEQVLEEAEALCAGEGDAAIAELIAAVPALGDEVRAMLALAHVDEAAVTPIFARTDAVGSVMRKKIEPVTRVLLEQMAVLRGRE